MSSRQKAERCEIEWCDQVARSQGLCRAHYQRKLRKGSPVPECKACGAQIKQLRRQLCDGCLGLRGRSKMCQRCRGPKELTDLRVCKRCLQQDADEVRVCNTCGKSLSLLQFGTTVSPKSGKIYTDKRCYLCKQEKQRDQALRRRYGITLDEYNSMLARQGGVCAICGGAPKTQPLHVDHNHKTGAIRGLLCNWCNFKVLGGSKESSRILRAAADYLDRYV